MKTQLFLDLDEVLVDFTTAAAACHGLTRARLEGLRPRGVWDFCEFLGMNEKLVWERITAKGMGFWTGLKKTRWYGQLLNLVFRYFDPNQVWVVTSPAPNKLDDGSSRLGKEIWLQTNWHNDQYYITNYKYMLAAPGRILVDDRAENVDQWKACGGMGLLFPFTGNELYAYASDPVPYLEEQFDALDLS